MNSRNDKIRAMRKSRIKLSAIAAEFGLTDARVSQICMGRKKVDRRTKRVVRLGYHLSRDVDVEAFNRRMEPEALLREAIAAIAGRNLWAIIDGPQVTL